jgi:chitinase
VQKIIDKSPLTVNDDVVSNDPNSHDDAVLIGFWISFNTQGSSQWDSLRHFAYQKEKTFYNGYVASLTRP